VKYCTGCCQHLPTERFWLKSRATGELQDWCKACRRSWRTTYREIERERDRERDRRTRALKATQ